MVEYKMIGVDKLSSIKRLLDAFCLELNLSEAESTNFIVNLENGDNRIFIATENEHIKGIGGYIPVGIEAIGNFMYVTPKDRGGIIGGKLYHMMEDDAAEQGCKVIKILVALQRVNLYKGVGFKVSHCLLEKEV